MAAGESGKERAKAEREARLARALRENLKRRKAQMRREARPAEEAPAPGPKPTPDPENGRE